MTDKIDVLYFIGRGSRWKNNELRYSLRSLHRYASGVGRVFVVGEDPGFLSDAVQFYKIPEAAGNKEYRIAAKILWACEHTDISDEFWCFNDDHILMQPTDAITYPFYHKGELPHGGKPPTGGYRRALYMTHAALSKEGYPAHHFDIHVPIRYRKDAFLALDQWWHRSRRARDGLVVKSIYANITTGIEPVYKMHDLKINKCNGRNDVEARIKNRHVFSFGDAGIEGGVRQFLERKFVIKSPFER